MKQNLILGLIIVISIGITACGGSGKAADKDAKVIVEKIFPTTQSATSFDSAKKYSSGEIKIKNFSITPVALGKKFTFDELSIKKFDAKNDKPRFYKMSFKGLHFTNDMFPNPSIPAQLKAAGIEELVLDLDIEQNYQTSDKSFKLAMNFSLRKLAELTINFDLANVDESILDPAAAADPNKAMMTISAAQLKSASITLRNIGVMQKIKEKMSPEMLQMGKKQVLLQADKAIDPIQKNILKAFAQFIDNQGSIRIGANPLQPINIGLLMNPTTQKEALNKLNITAISQ